MTTTSPASAGPSGPSGPLAFVHRRRRGAELFLLVLALMVGIGAYAAVGVGVEESVPADLVGYGGWLAALIPDEFGGGGLNIAIQRAGLATQHAVAGAH